MDVKTHFPLDSLVWLEHADPGGAPAGMSTNGYVLLAGGEALAVDLAFASLLANLHALAADGHVPVGMVLSHRHLAGNGDAFDRFQTDFDAPVFLHPLDARHPQARRAGVKFEDPTTSDLPARFGVEVIHFPGQTEGSVMLYRTGDALLLAGDSAMGTTTPQAEQGLRRFVRPPEHTSSDDRQLRDGWHAFERPVAHLAPYHGTPMIAVAGDLPRTMEPLGRAEATLDVTGRTATGERDEQPT